MIKGALVRCRGQFDHDLPRGAVRAGDEVGRDVGELCDASRAIELAVQLGPGIFPDVEPISERSGEGWGALLVNGALNNFSFAATLPEARGVFIDTGDLIRLWDGSRRVFLVVRRPRGQSVVAAPPLARVHELGLYGSRWLYSNR